MKSPCVRNLVCQLSISSLAITSLASAAFASGEDLSKAVVPYESPTRSQSQSPSQSKGDSEQPSSQSSDTLEVPGATPKSRADRNAIQRFFHFENGNKLRFKMKSRGEAKGNVDLLDSSGNVLKHIKSNFTFDFARDSYDLDNSALFSGVMVERADAPGTFTWFAGKQGFFVVFQDGALTKSCASETKAIAAQKLTYGGQDYLIESALNETNEANTFISTFPAFEADPSGKNDGPFPDRKCQALDHKFHRFENPQAMRLSKDGVLSIDEVEAQVSLKDMNVFWEFNYGENKFFFSSVNSDDKNEDGLFLTRSKDKKSVRVDYQHLSDETSSPGGGFASLMRSKKQARALSPLRSKSGIPYDVKNGIFSVPGVAKRIDLERFDVEARLAKRLGKAATVWESDGEALNVIEAFMSQGYKDLVQDSLDHPDLYIERADPIVMEAMGDSIRAGRSPAVLGKPGTGKTSAVRAFAREVGLGRIPGIPRTTRIFSIAAANLASNNGNTGVIDKRVAALIAAAKETGWILYFDEIHTLSGVGTHSNKPFDITQEFKVPMSAGELTLIGSDDTVRFTSAFAGDPAFDERFDRVIVSAPINEDLITVIAAKIKKMEEPVPAREVIEAAIQYSDQYNITTAQPRAAIDLITIAYSKMPGAGFEGQPLNLEVLRKAVFSKYRVDPIQFSKPKLRERLATLKAGLNAEIIGQKAAKQAIYNLWTAKLANVTDPEEVNSILLVGPSAVGKSQIAVTSAKLMGYDYKVIEMNKYHDLFGSADRFRREVYLALMENPIRVIVLDELEKAAIEVQQAALSMLQSGEFTVLEETNASGRFVPREVNARNAVFVLTSNAAADYIVETMGKQRSLKVDAKALAKRLRGDIDPAILSRIQDTVPMTFPTEADFQKGIEHYLDRTLKRVGNKYNLDLQVSHRDDLLKELYAYRTDNSEFRDIKHLIKKTIERALAEMLMTTEFDEPQNVRVTKVLEWNKDNWPDLPKTEERLTDRYFY